MKTVKFEQRVVRQLISISYQMFERGYFSDVEYAITYTTQLLHYFIQNIDSNVKHDAPTYFKRYDKQLKYIKYIKNRRTTWYAFFEETESQYIIKFITNNHIDGHHFE